MDTNLTWIMETFSLQRCHKILCCLKLVQWSLSAIQREMIFNDTKVLNPLCLFNLVSFQFINRYPSSEDPQVSITILKILGICKPLSD